MNTFRMGSFTSSVKIDNEDSQDKELNFDSQVTYQQLLDYCLIHNDQCPHSQLIKRTFQTVPYGSIAFYIFKKYIMLLFLYYKLYVKYNLYKLRAN